jgi:hypothetical protein
MKNKNLLHLLLLVLLTHFNPLKSQNPYCNPCINSPCLTVSFDNKCICPMKWLFLQGSNPACSESPVFYVDHNMYIPPFQIPCLACDNGQCLCSNGIKLLDPCSNAELFSTQFTTLNPNPLTQSYPFSVDVRDLQISGNCCLPNSNVNVKFTFTSPTTCVIETTCN